MWNPPIWISGVVGRNYLHRLMKRIDVYDDEIRLIPKEVLAEYRQISMSLRTFCLFFRTYGR